MEKFVGFFRVELKNKMFCNHCFFNMWRMPEGMYWCEANNNIEAAYIRPDDSMPRPLEKCPLKNLGDSFLFDTNDARFLTFKDKILLSSPKYGVFELEDEKGELNFVPVKIKWEKEQEHEKSEPQ